MKTGTLKELNVQAGDVVKFVNNTTYTIKMRHGELWAFNNRFDCSKFPVETSLETYTIVSRVNPDPLPYGHVTLLDGRTVDLTSERQYRCDMMDPEELQAMKDHGGPWDSWVRGDWRNLEGEPSWYPDTAYRVAPKPVVETVVTYWNADWGYCSADKVGATQKIALTIKDGDIIDAKPEKL